MALSYRGDAFASAAFGSSVQPSVPSGTVDGEIMLGIATAVWPVGSRTLTPPSGWTSLQTGDDKGTFHTWIYYRRASSEPSTYQWSLSASARFLVAHATISGNHATTEVDNSNQQYQENSNVIAASIIPSADDCLLVFVGAIQDDITFTPPSGMAEQFDENETQVALTIATEQLTGSSATGTRTATPSSTDDNYGFLITIPPAPAGGDTFAPTIRAVRQQRVVYIRM